MHKYETCKIRFIVWTPRRIYNDHKTNKIFFFLLFLTYLGFGRASMNFLRIRLNTAFSKHIILFELLFSLLESSFTGFYVRVRGDLLLFKFILFLVVSSVWKVNIIPVFRVVLFLLFSIFLVRDHCWTTLLPCFFFIIFSPPHACMFWCAKITNRRTAK